MWGRRFMWIAWPAFLMAGVVEMLIFAVVDPDRTGYRRGLAAGVRPSARSPNRSAHLASGRGSKWAAGCCWFWRHVAGLAGVQADRVAVSPDETSRSAQTCHVFHD